MIQQTLIIFPANSTKNGCIINLTGLFVEMLAVRQQLTEIIYCWVFGFLETILCDFEMEMRPSLHSFDENVGKQAL